MYSLQVTLPQAENNMAKKRTRGGDFNMSEQLRKIIRENRRITFPEAHEPLQKQCPGENINENSASVVFYNARRQVGVKKRVGKKATTKKQATGRKKGTKQTVRRRRPSAQTVDISALQAAAKFLAVVGDTETAMAALKQVQSLQID